jgi:hypothetical protein
MWRVSSLTDDKKNENKYGSLRVIFCLKTISQSHKLQRSHKEISKQW